MAESEKKASALGNISPGRDLMERLWDAKIVLGLALGAVLVHGYYGTKDAVLYPGIMSTTQITHNPKQVIGKTVTVRSKPIKKIGLSSFTVSDKQLLGGEPVVVVNASGEPFELPTNKKTEVQVTGQVRRLVIPQIEKEYNLSLQEKSYKNYRNKPAIIAKSIELAPPEK